MKTVAFVPIRLNSQRVAGKNLRPLDGSPLMCHILKTLTEVEGIDEVYVFCSDEGIRAPLPEGSGCCSATRRSTATRRSDGRFTTASPPGSGPTSTSSPTPPRRSSAPRPLPMRSAKCVRANTTRRSAPKNPDFRLVRRPSAQLRSRQHPPHADHRAGLHRDQRLLHLFAGVVVRPRPPHRRSSLHGRRGPHRGFGHRLPRGLRHGRNHRGEPEPAGINKSRSCELAGSEDFRFAGGESAGRSSALRKPAIPHAP